MNTVNIRRFQGFCNREFGLREIEQQIIEEKVKKPQIKTETIFNSGFMMGILGSGSFLKFDQMARKKAMKRLLKRKKSKVAVSDTELIRRLGGFQTKEIEEGLIEIVMKAQEMNLMKVKLPGGESLRIGSIDGTEFGKFKRSCFQMLGEVNLFMAMEEIEKRGKELPSSKRLLIRLRNKFGKGFVDIILADALYGNQPYIDTCTEELGIDAVVKIREKDEETRKLDIIKEVDMIVAHYQETKGNVVGVEHIRGTDVNRLVEYEAWAVSDLYNLGTVKPLKVAKVVEEEIKSEKKSTYYVITTRQSLKVEQLRQLGHDRWSIENNGFKAFNAQVKSKRVYTDDEKVFEPLYLIFMMAFDLLLIYYHLFGDLLKQLYPGARLTLAFLVSELYDSIIILYYDSS